MTEALPSLTVFVDAASEAKPLVLAQTMEDDAQTAALTRRLVAGEERAWQEFHDGYGDRLTRYLLVVCRGDEHAAREGLQAALVRIVRHIRHFDRAEALWGWLTVVARSCVVDGVRRQSRYRALLERYAGFFGVASAVAEEDPLPALLVETLGNLEEEDQVLLVAKYHEGQRTADLAAERGCSEKAIESRLARLRQRLRSEILQRLNHEN